MHLKSETYQETFYPVDLCKLTAAAEACPPNPVNTVHLNQLCFTEARPPKPRLAHAEVL